MNSLKTAVKHGEQGEWLERPAYQDGLPAYETWASALEKLAEGGEQNGLNYYAERTLQQGITLSATCAWLQR